MKSPVVPDVLSRRSFRRFPKYKRRKRRKYSKNRRKSLNKIEERNTEILDYMAPDLYDDVIDYGDKEYSEKITLFLEDNMNRSNLKNHRFDLKKLNKKEYVKQHQSDIPLPSTFLDNMKSSLSVNNPHTLTQKTQHGTIGSNFGQMGLFSKMGHKESHPVPSAITRTELLH